MGVSRHVHVVVLLLLYVPWSSSNALVVLPTTTTGKPRLVVQRGKYHPCRAALYYSKDTDDNTVAAHDNDHDVRNRPTIVTAAAAVDDSDPSPSRRSFLAAGVTAFVTSSTLAQAAAAASTSGNDEYYYWPYWLALPVFPFAYRRTLRQQVTSRVWTFDQLIGIYYVHVPIRMTVIALESGGLLVYAPVAATPECLDLLQPLVDEFGPIKTIVLPTVAVEHKVLAGPFARMFPDADFFITDQQYSFPINLPDRTLGLPKWAKLLPPQGGASFWGNDELQHQVLTVKPGVGSMYQDVALWHKPTKTLLVCDALFAVNAEPPAILTHFAEYRKALLFHAREYPTDLPADTPANIRKGWRRIVLLFNFFFPNYSAKVDLGLAPLTKLQPGYPYGWAAWMPFDWKSAAQEEESFGRYIAGGKPTLYTIVQIILSRGDSGQATREWVDIVKTWDFQRVIVAHLDAPLNIGPKEFAATFDFLYEGENVVRYCDEDVAFLRAAEEGPLKFSVYPSTLGVLRGQPCDGES